jgi:hypothetical protein
MCFNGWKNYETWCVSLWIDNSRDSYEAARNMCRGRHSALSAPILREWVEEMNPLSEKSGLFSDLLRSVLGEVDYYEIVEDYEREEKNGVS